MDADITGALSDWAAGDSSALNRIAPAVYPKLRDLARAFLKGERPGHTWQATALVHELFLKLLAKQDPRYENRRHFYNACAQLMRLALIDHARQAQRDKRGGQHIFIPLHEELPWINAASPAMLDLDDAMRELSALDPDQAAMFETRYLLGCSVEETADLFHTSKSSVDRKIRIARAWLYRRLNPASDNDNGPPL